MDYVKKKIKLAIAKNNLYIHTEILEPYGDEVLSDITVKQIYGGMRGVPSMVCNTSYVDPNEGLHMRGVHISELINKLPEEIFYFLITGEFPDKISLEEIQQQLYMRSHVREYVWDILKTMPKNAHPMTMLSMGIMALEQYSVFKSKYASGLNKKHYWEATLEDSLDLLAAIISLAAGIYHLKYYTKITHKYDPALGWGDNFAKYFGIEDNDGSFKKLINLYLVLHCDHEGGNVSAFTSRVVNSALSNINLSAAAGLNGLAGPLHGLANQEVMRFIFDIMDLYDSDPTEEQVSEYIKSTLSLGKVIPGYGHAVLKKVDPRFTAFYEFGEKYCNDDPIFNMVKKIYKVAPGILSSYSGGKIANPYPNVDAISGALLYKFGITKFDFYTVLFGVARTIGFCAQAVLARGLMAPIVRPKSLTNENVLEILNKKGVINKKVPKVDSKDLIGKKTPKLKK